MKTFLVALFTALVFTGLSSVGTTYYLDNAFSHDFQEMTGLTWEEFDKAYAGCVVTSGELCNLYGGFAPLSKFNDGRDGNEPKAPGRAL